MATDAECWQFLERLNPEWVRKDDFFRSEYHVRIGFRATKKYDTLREMIEAGIECEKEQKLKKI